jgi:hypothetical protein
VGGSCGTHGKGGKNCTRFWSKSPKKGDQSEYGGIDVRMGPNGIFGRMAGRVLQWIQVAQDRDRWRTVVNMVVSHRVLAPRSWLVTWKLRVGGGHTEPSSVKEFLYTVVRWQQASIHPQLASTVLVICAKESKTEGGKRRIRFVHGGCRVTR